ncbi:MAG: T9SS type A sorting domain-containing protein [Chitinophagales bacterium]|nr:T9SS type A sorting domain-containing protein [Chitinophagales bacterium]
MKSTIPYLSLTILLLSGFLFFKYPTIKTAAHNEQEDVSEDYFLMRAYPDAAVDMQAYDAALKDAMTPKSAQRESAAWTVEGPGNIGGRINCMAIEPGNPDVIYEGNAAGGIFKTTDGGITWNAIFDNEPYLSIGAITVDPNNPQTIWAGTGDVNISGYVFIGDGIYKSTDGGGTWKNMGLSETKIISKIIVDSSNSNIVYAATMGLPFETNTDRGLYKSIDGGETWSKILFVDVDAGIIDMVIDPVNPNIIYAASWNRIRNNYFSEVYGPDAHIYKTTDGGSTWNILNNGLPDFTTCRIGLAISKQNPEKLYAIIVDTIQFGVQGIYKTINGGTTWTNALGNFDQETFGTQGWYFGKIYVNPANDEQIYVPGVELQTSTDGGNKWNPATPSWYSYLVHADGHYMEFVDQNNFYYCTDGGMYKTTDNCNTWTDCENIPNTQFYHVTFNENDPSDYFGGAQDNGTLSGSNASFNGWNRTFGGDGFKPYFNPNNAMVQYAETQNGGLWYTTDAGNSYTPFTNNLDLERQSWDMPYLMSPLDPTVFYCGTYQMNKLTDAPFGSWLPISEDLTDGTDDRFHVITTLTQSPLNGLILYSGTSDGNVWSTTDDGNTWNLVSSNLPDRYVTSVQASPNEVNTVYVTHSGYRDNDYIPHVHKSIDNGKNWLDISGDLPQLAANDILISPADETIIYVATDGGVYKTENGGVNWNRLGSNMPFIPVYDIEFNLSNNKVIAGTFARSIWTIDAETEVGIASVDKSLKAMSIFPNPASNVITIDLEENSANKISFYDAAGQLMLPERVGSSAGLVSFSLKDFMPGIYYIHILSGKENVVQKFVKVM